MLKVSVKQKETFTLKNIGIVEISHRRLARRDLREGYTVF